MSRFDEQYLDLCNRILEHGDKITTDPAVLKKKLSSTTKTNMPNHYAQTVKPTTTFSLPHEVLTFDLAEEFPILTTKRVAFKTSVLEMLWIYQVASNDVKWLHDRGVKIWDEWEIPENGIYMGRDFKKLYAKKGIKENPVGTIGTAYGWIVNRYHLVESLIDTIKTDPTNRRMIMSLWQNEWLETAALPSCVWNSQWNVSGGKLNIMVTVRSNDVPLGMPFNVSQYATLCYLLAHITGLQPGKMTYVINNAHIYENQVDGIKEQMTKESYPAPTLWINPEITDFYAFDNSKELKVIRLDNYQNDGTIRMPVTE